ncbi:MAG: zf-HC2 domain-containing protein [bacterium]
MAIEHFSDELIQQYLDGALSPSQIEAVTGHAADCPDCARKVRQYEQLFAGLADDSGFELPTNFAAAVAHRAESGSVSERSFGWLAIAAGIAAALVVIGYYFDLSWVGPSLESLGREQQTLFTDLFGRCTTLIAGFGLRPDLLFFGGLTLLVISGLDRVVQAVRHGRAVFMA